MMVIPLTNSPNQSFTVRLEDMRFELRLKETNGVMSIDITIDGVVKLQGQRVLAGEPVIPFPYLMAGNFVMLTDNGDLPDYTQFGLSQTLVYMSAAELLAVV